ncbi:hypothetical protein [Actinoplanes awajinensis]|nr:hypothetical protein [Actinoplanes awajinensis]
MMKTFDRWEFRARIALGDRGIEYHEASPLIDDARAHVEESGTDPWQALGSPEEFAEEVAAARPAAQARRDTQGRTSADHLSNGLFLLAVNGVPASLVAIGVSGLMLPLTVSGTLGTVLLVATMLVLVAAPGALRAAGRPRLANGSFAAAAMLFVATVAAFAWLPRERFGAIPTLVPLVVSLALCWLLTRPARAPKQATGHQAVSGAGPADPARSGSSADTAGPAEPEAWFARLHGLLAGRFDVPADRATDLVEQA